jgi:hypothetical protein
MVAATLVLLVVIELALAAAEIEGLAAEAEAC